MYDTMLFFQAATKPGRVHASMRGVVDGHISLAISRQLLIEIESVLRRPEYELKFPVLTPLAVDNFLETIRSQAELFDPVPDLFTWPQHPDDDHVFNLAIHASAKYLVTWETRILKLATEMTPAAVRLRGLAPQLAIITPQQLAMSLKS